MPTSQYDPWSRYASPMMRKLWSDEHKFSTWRQLWAWLAESQAALGLPISRAQIEELWANVYTVDLDVAAKYEEQLHHDVMAHIRALGDQCPTAKPIIHLGATSCYITDNTDLIIMKSAMVRIRTLLIELIDTLGSFATKFRDMITLGYTHLQPAQPVTVGRRACLWAYDLALDLRDLEDRLNKLMARGVRGATGTQASFLQLFNGDHNKVIMLERLIAHKLGFNKILPITGQTYTRKIDSQIMNVLSGIAASAHKACTDIRLLAHMGEIEEGVGGAQVGSSTMMFKRNPMRCERVCGLARFAMNLQSNADQTLAVQWFERSLDDSSNRRLVIPQAFLTIDAVLTTYINIIRDLRINPEIIKSRLHQQLDKLSLEHIMMIMTAAGGDRQEIHERLRVHSRNPEFKVSDLEKDPYFTGMAVIDQNQLIGRSREQVDEFIKEVVDPIRYEYLNP